MSELFNAVPDDQFSAHSNLNCGQRKGSQNSRAGETLVDWMKRFKSGRETFTGGGNVDIVFAVPFPSTSYQILFGGSATATTPIYANQVATGFRITAAAAGVVDWICIYNGPTS